MDKDSPVQRKNIDLFEIITVLGDRAAASAWYSSGMECFGSGADELHNLSDNHLPVSGADLLRITSQINQTIDGDLKAYENDEPDPWIFVRAWDGSGFYFETADLQIIELFRSRFDFFEEVYAEYQPEPPMLNFFLNFFLKKPDLP